MSLPKRFDLKGFVSVMTRFGNDILKYSAEYRGRYLLKGVKYCTTQFKTNVCLFLNNCIFPRWSCIYCNKHSAMTLNKHALESKTIYNMISAYLPTGERCTLHRRWRFLKLLITWLLLLDYLSCLLYFAVLSHRFGNDKNIGDTVL